jgi:hypothetical protein
MKLLAKNLFITFIVSILITAAITCIYYAVIQKGGNYQHEVPAIISGVFFLDVILLVMSLPALFLAFPSYWNNVLVRVMLYFCGPVCFLIAVFNIRLKAEDGVVYLMAGIIFLVIHGWFYYRTNKIKA